VCAAAAAVPSQGEHQSGICLLQAQNWLLSQLLTPNASGE